MATDLGPCPGDGLRVADRVILDGAGHTIIGSGSKRSVGLQIASKGSGSFVQNVVVRGFERGVRLNGASAVELTNVEAHHNGDVQARVGYGIDLAGGASNNRIVRARVHSNADEGIHVGSHGRGNRIEHSEIYDNGRENVYVLEGTDNTIDSCTLRGAGNAAVYIKHSKGTTISRTKVRDRPVIVRGGSLRTRMIENTLEDAGVVLQPYAEEKRGRSVPRETLLRGGSIAGSAECLRVDGATATTVDGVRLGCATALVLAGGSDVSLSEPSVSIRCAGAGLARELSAVQVRFVDGDGRPVPGVLLSTSGPGGTPLGSADAQGGFSGMLPRVVRECPRLVERPPAPIALTWAGNERLRPVAELHGTVVLERPEGQADTERRAD